VNGIRELDGDTLVEGAHRKSDSQDVRVNPLAEGLLGARGVSDRFHPDTIEVGACERDEGRMEILLQECPLLGLL
jgi:hypothetical protein